MARYTPDKRTMMAPTSNAVRPAITGAASNAYGMPYGASSAAVYAPRPNHAAWPKLGIPPGPIMRCRLVANRIATSASVATDSANGPATSGAATASSSASAARRRCQGPDGRNSMATPGSRAGASGRPRRPCGRTTSTAAITANTSTNVTCGASATPNACSTPNSTAARYAPPMLPSPPTTTTTNASVMIARSIPGLADPAGNASTPPKPANAEPRVNTPVNSQR